MSKTTLTRKALAHALSDRSSGKISVAEARELVEAVIEGVVKGLQDDGIVKLHGFGIFRVSDKAERPARNPRTGEFAVVHARRSISFRPSPLVIEQLNPHLSDSEAEDEPERVVASLNGRARTFA